MAVQESAAQLSMTLKVQEYPTLKVRSGRDQSRYHTFEGAVGALRLGRGGSRFSRGCTAGGGVGVGGAVALRGVRQGPGPFGGAPGSSLHLGDPMARGGGV